MLVQQLSKRERVNKKAVGSIATNWLASFGKASHSNSTLTSSSCQYLHKWYLSFFSIFTTRWNNFRIQSEVSPHDKIFLHWPCLLCPRDKYQVSGGCSMLHPTLRSIHPSQSTRLCTTVLHQGVTNIRIFEYIQTFSDTNIRSYHIRIIFFIWIYSDIRSYCFFDTNILRYSFVSFFWYKYIRIFIHIVIYTDNKKSNI